MMCHLEMFHVQANISSGFAISMPMTTVCKPASKKTHCNTSKCQPIFRVLYTVITRKPSCRWQTRATRCNVIVAPLVEKRLAISTKCIHRWKVHLVGYNSVANSTGLSPSVQLLLPSKCTKSHKIPREFNLIAVQGNPRSSILVSMESPYVTSYWSSIVTLAVSATVFEIFTVKDRKLLTLPTPALFDAP